MEIPSLFPIQCPNIGTQEVVGFADQCQKVRLALFSTFTRNMKAATTPTASESVCLPCWCTHRQVLAQAASGTSFNFRVLTFL